MAIGVGFAGLVVIGFIVFLVVIFAATSIRIIRPHQKGLIERLGKFRRTAESGMTLVIPFVETMLKIDMREQVIDIPPQEVITKDNAAVTVDAVVYYIVTDPIRVVYNVANFQLAAVKLAQTNLRNLVGDLELDQTLTSRETINTKLRLILDEATDSWGVKVNRVELQKIEPPRDIIEAMSRQMKAEREKRAAILEAEGFKQSAILKAEGDRQSNILEAEGQAEAIKTVAEAHRFEKLTLAAGEGEAIKTVYNAIHEGKPTSDLLAIKYLETLGTMADGQATKIFLPVEASGILGAMAGIAESMNIKKEGAPAEK